MHIHIIAFEEYSNYKQKIHDDKLTLCEGKSGSGKSTFMRAIMWALYGGSTSGEKYEVVLKHNNIKITRGSRPASLMVIDADGTEHPGEDGQHIINRVFGAEDLFKLCCYMEQGDTPCPLFSPKNKERLYYLTKLAFRDSEDPMIIIDKIRERMKLEKKKSKEITEDYDSKKKGYNEEVEARPLTEDERSAEDLENLLSVLSDRINESEAKVLSNHKNTAIATTLNGALVENKSKLLKKKLELDSLVADIKNNEYEKKIPELLKEKEVFELNIANTRQDITTIKNNIKNNSEHIAIAKKVGQYRILKTELENEYLTNTKVSDRIPETLAHPKFSDRDLFNLEKEWSNYDEALKVANKLAIEYYEEAINNEKNRLNAIIEYYEQQEQYTVYTGFKKKYESLEIVTESQIDKEQHLYQAMKNSMDVLTCPNCDITLRYTGGGALVEEKNAVVTTKEEISAKEELIKRLKRILKDREKLKEFLEECEVTEPPHIPEYLMPFSDASNRLSKLKNLKVYSKPVLALNIARKLVQYYGLKSELAKVDLESFKEITTTDVDDLKRELKEKETYTETLNTKLEKITKKYKDAKKNQADALKKQDAIKSSLRELEEITANQENQWATSTNLINESIEEDHNKLVKRKARLEKLLAERVYSDKMLKRKKDLKKMHKMVKRVQQISIDWSELYENAVAEHYEHLQNVVDNINLCLVEVINILFSDYPVRVELELYTINKKQHYKHKISMNVTRKGKTVPEMKKLSGGERKRVMLAISVALNIIYRAPIIMYDEICDSLDQEMRERCLSVMRTYIDNRTIICAEHFAEAGNYDHSIQFEINRDPKGSGGKSRKKKNN